MIIPDYIQEEIDKYMIERNNGIKRFTTYENIIAFINLARVAGRITNEEAEAIKKMIPI